ncbi:flagellar motor switch protein FliM [Edaphobacter aggregans]|uniref:Flagellar motor switch protein FliM n=1 Tax=Edaphobacter aggregans TaxID=570835 RepID=A0A3R9P127_9BACT|nr:FliM/FliN family flagellar motor switch protein [Edaphobacter aggregans]RSL19471.1 flagellar motor switch protein FliM [Edaphobacter aggregans]
MEKNLLQEDIDALFAAAGANATAKTNDNGDAKPPEKYSFSNAGQISNDQMRAISTVNDLFARNLMHTLGAWLRMPLKVKLVSGEQLPFNEFLERLSTMSYICSVRLEPLGAVGLLELDLALAAPIVDVLLGGTGRAGQVRELTDIEEAILTAVVQVVMQELNLAWQPVGLVFAFEKRETEAQAARTMTLGEKTLCVSFEARMPEVQGVLNLCLPAVVLNAILRRLIAQGDQPRRRSKDAQAKMRELVGEVKVGAVLQFPPVRLRAAELSSLEPGAVLRLPLPRYQMAELRVGGLQFGRAYPVRTGEHRGAQIEGENCGSLMKLSSGNDVAAATTSVN